MSIFKFSLSLKKYVFTWKNLSTNHLVLLAHRVVLFLFVFALVILIWQWKKLPPMVPLWYSRPWGEDQLAHPFWLLILPFSGLFWHLINIIVSVKFLQEHLTFSQLLFLSSFIVNLFSFIALVQILFLIT